MTQFFKRSFKWTIKISISKIVGIWLIEEEFEFSSKQIKLAKTIHFSKINLRTSIIFCLKIGRQTQSFKALFVDVYVCLCSRVCWIN